MAGRGIALGWRQLVDDMLEQGLLVPVGPEVRRLGSGYYLLWPKGQPGEAVTGLAIWLATLIGE